MQWFGYEIPAKEPKPAASWQSISAKDPNSLVEVFRFSHDTQKRKSALEELKKLGLVEHLDNANAPTSSINHT